MLFGDNAHTSHRSPYPAVAMTVHPVSTLVNKPTNDDRRCVEPVTA